MAGKEDQRQAVGIVTTLSGQLMAAALGMIALEGAFLTFALDKKACGFWFWCAVVTAFLSFVFSIVRGGKGIAKLYKAGGNGAWDCRMGDAHFQWQTGLCLIGLFAFMIAVACARKDKASDGDAVKNEITKVAAALDKQTMVVQQLLFQMQSNRPPVESPEVIRLRIQFEELSNRFEHMQAERAPVITNVVQVAGFTNLIQVGPMTNVISMPEMTNIMEIHLNGTSLPPVKPFSMRRWGIMIGAERLN